MVPLDSFQNSLFSWVLPICLDHSYGCVNTAEFIWFDSLPTQRIIGKIKSSSHLTQDFLNHNMHFNKIPRWLVCAFQFSIILQQESSTPITLLDSYHIYICVFVSIICNVFSFIQNMDKSYTAQVSTISRVHTDLKFSNLKSSQYVFNYMLFGMKC